MKKPKYLTDPKTFNDEYKRLVELKSEATSLRTELLELKNSFSDIKTLPEDAKTKLKYIDNREKRSETILAEIADTQKTSEAIVGELNKTKEEFDKALKRTTDTESSIGLIVKNAATASDEAGKIKSRIDDLNKEARRLLGKAVGGSLSAGFSSRAKNISGSKWTWMLILVLASIAAPFIAVFVFSNVDATKFVGNDPLAGSVFKFVTLSPLVFFITYSSIQYSKERDLQEKYEFKSATAQSLPAYTKIIKDEFYEGGAILGHEDDLLNFAINSINKVYNEPYITSDKRRTFLQVNLGKSGARIKMQDEESGVAAAIDAKRVEVTQQAPIIPEVIEA